MGGIRTRSTHSFQLAVNMYHKGRLAYGLVKQYESTFTENSFQQAFLTTKEIRWIKFKSEKSMTDDFSFLNEIRIWLFKIFLINIQHVFKNLLSLRSSQENQKQLENEINKMHSFKN